MRASDLVVRTRLIPPRVRGDLIARPALADRLRRMLDVPLTVIKADAGYGKSTAVAVHLCASPRPYFWYSLSEADADPLLFLLHLIAAFRARLPACGRTALSLLEQEGGAAKLWAPAVDALVNDLLDHLEQDTVFVLDDYHLVDRPQVQAIVERLIEHMPPSLHVVLVTRHSPRLSRLARWRARGDVLEIGRDDLAFTPDEVAELIDRRVSIRLSAEHAQALVAETEGWAIALLMVCQHLQRTGARGVDRLLGRLPDSLPGLFVYLAEDVLMGQPTEIRDFLVGTSVLRRLDAEVCDEVLGRPDSASTLQYLDDHSLFVIHLGNGSYRYHHLFQDFLIRSVGEEQRGVLHRRAAAFYRRRGERDEAIHHLLQAGEHGAAAELLASIASGMIQAGRYETLASWLDRLPESVLAGYPELGISRGDAYRLTSRYQEAVSHYEAAYRAAQASGDPVAQARARQGHALVYLDTVQPVRAEPLLQEARRLVRRAAPDMKPLLLSLLAENRINQGRLPQAARLLGAIKRYGECPVPTGIEIRHTVRTGRLEAAREVLERDLRDDPWGVGQPRMPRSHREPAVLLAWVCALCGDGEAARRYAEWGLQVGRELRSPIVECVALSRLGHAWLAGPDADIGRALDCYRRSLEVAERIGVERFKVESLMGRTIAGCRLGDFALAERDAHAALAILADAGDAYLAGIVRLALGGAAVTCGHAEAAAWLTEAETIGRSCGDFFGPAVAALWQAVLACRHPDWSRFDDACARILAASAAQGYEFLFLEQTLLGPNPLREGLEVLRRARERGVENNYAARLLQKLVERHPEATGTPERRPWWVRLSEGRVPRASSIHVQALGEFRIWLGDREIPRSAWGREKALRLFQILLCHKGRRVRREQAAAALWPEATPREASARLRVTLAAAKRVLRLEQPDRPGDDLSSAVLSDGKALWLNPEIDLRVDADEFTRLVERARGMEARDPDAALEEYRRALRLYQGDFLADCAYEDWAADERERLLSLYLSAGVRVAEFLTDRRRYDEAVHLCQQILERDPCWEDAYYLLMRCHAEQGNRALAMRIYQRCATRLAQDLGVMPSPRTVALRDAIARQRDASSALPGQATRSL